MEDLIKSLHDKTLNPQFEQIVKDSGIATLSPDLLTANDGISATPFNLLAKQIIIEPAKRRGKDGFKNINSREIKFKVWRYLTASTCDEEFEDSQIADAAKHIAQRFESEYNYTYNKRRYPGF